MMEIEQTGPPAGLRAHILREISQEEQRRARVYLLGSTAVILFSVFSVVYSTRYMLQEFYQSSFYNYVSLLFSDSDMVFMYWREFGLSLAESLPFAGVTVLLIAVAVLLISIRVVANNSRSDFLPSFTNS